MPQVAGPAALRPVLERALAVVRSGRPYVLDVLIKRRFDGADVSWHEKFLGRALGSGD